MYGSTKVLLSIENFGMWCSHSQLQYDGRSSKSKLSSNNETANATVTVAHSRTKDLVNMLKYFDIVVVAVGIPKFISAKDLAPGCVLVDAGYHPMEKCGDVDMTDISNIVSAYTPVPGGVGPMTINLSLIHI